MVPRKRQRTITKTNEALRFENELKENHFKVVRNKKFVYERSFNFKSLRDYPQIKTIAQNCGWLRFNSMIGEYNTTWVHEFYANALGYRNDEYVSYVRGKEVSYAPEVLETVFGFNHVEQCLVAARRDQEYEEYDDVK
ncbi:hypothetical protein A2U01_0007154, partial [Trifolium medium]|nr:hypothetical protein [Trifolium medium]